MCKLLKNTCYWWDEACEKSFQWMITILIMSPVLIVPDWIKEFHVHTNALNYPIGTRLYQNPNDTIGKLIIMPTN
jgi:hypothetical protein